MKDKDLDKKSSESKKEESAKARIKQEAPDLTELVFDLFFDKEFKGNINPSEDPERKTNQKK